MRPKPAKMFSTPMPPLSLPPSQYVVQLRKKKERLRWKKNVLLGGLYVVACVILIILFL